MSSAKRKALVAKIYEEGRQAGYNRESWHKCPYQAMAEFQWKNGYDAGRREWLNQLIERAQRALDALELPVIADAELAAWNEEKNACAMFERDISLPGWQEQDGCLVKEFYVKDPDEVEFGLLRHAWFGDFVGGTDYTLIITDADHNEIASS